MRRQRRGTKVLALLLGLSLVAAACGGDDDDGGGDAGAGGEEPQQGGELVDIGTFPSDPPEHIDPALNVTLDAYQVVNALYDGLTEIDASDPENPEIVGAVAESWESNEDATVWTFTIREGLAFSNGEELLPSSFVRGWERASDPDFAGDYSYLFNFIEGGAEKLDGSADTLAGVTADDDAMTLTVEMDAPYADWPWIAGFQLFMPMPEAVEELDDQTEWENGMMIGNGPFQLETERTDQEIVLVPNEEWDGTQYDEALELPDQPYLDRLTFRAAQDRDTAYQSFEAGEAQVGPIPDGQFEDAAQNWGTTTDIPMLASYYFEVRWDDPTIGGEDNLLLRQAISQAIDREDINEAVWDGLFEVATGVTPPGIPGFEEGLCDYCSYDPEAAEQALQEWEDAGNELTEPISIQFNTGEYHDQVVQIIIENLEAIGIEATDEPIETETYFTQLSEGACTICRSGWIADYATYDNFLYDLFHSDAIGGNNHGMYDVPEFDQLVDEAKATVDEEERADLYHQAEENLLNENIGVIPIAYYHGDYVYNEDEVVGFTQTNFSLIPYEKVGMSG